MPNVYVEPLPKNSDAAITGYALEFQDNKPVVAGKTYATQKDAIDTAKKLGHKPLVGRVRRTNKGIPDHWRSAD